MDLTNLDRDLERLFVRNYILDRVVLRHLESCQQLVDSPDYLPEKQLSKILKILFKFLKRNLRKVNPLYRKWLKAELAAVPAVEVKTETQGEPAAETPPPVTALLENDSAQ